MKIRVETLEDAKYASMMLDMTYREVEGGYLVMDYEEARIWDMQK